MQLADRQCKQLRAFILDAPNSWGKLESPQHFSPTLCDVDYWFLKTIMC